MELFPKPRSEYEYQPNINPLLKGVDVLLDPFMRKVSRGVLSHAWHWDKLPFDPRFKDYAIHIKGNPNAIPVEGLTTGLVYRVRTHLGLGTVPKGYILDVDLHQLPNPFELAEFYYCFSGLEMSSLNKSKIGMNRMFMMMTGPNDWFAYLMDKNGNPLPGKILTPLISWDEKPDGLAIL